MKKDIKKLWIEALRSGKYQQGRLGLKSHQDDGNECYCCLGVLVNECNIGTWVDLEYKFALEVGEEQFFGYPPHEFMSELGVKWSDVEVLAQLNDHASYDFEKIAEWIERNL
jgi:hypothetical protein